MILHLLHHHIPILYYGKVSCYHVQNYQFGENETICPFDHIHKSIFRSVYTQNFSSFALIIEYCEGNSKLRILCVWWHNFLTMHKSIIGINVHSNKKNKWKYFFTINYAAICSMQTPTIPHFHKTQIFDLYHDWYKYAHNNYISTSCKTPSKIYPIPTMDTPCKDVLAIHNQQITHKIADSWRYT